MIRTVLAYGLLLCLALPTAKAWQHALDGHIEIHCRQDIPNHIHQAEFGCDFDKYSFSVPLHAPVLELGLDNQPVFSRNSATHPVAPEQASFRYFALRAPPV